MTDEEKLAAYFYDAIKENLKNRIRADYPEIDSLPEAEAIELCLAHGRARKALFQCGA